jgi:gliding motility-associated-like protein
MTVKLLHNSIKKVLTILLALLYLSPSFSQTISPDSLLLHLPFDGDANDVSGNHYDGVVNGATPTAGQDGAPNTAYYFDGKSSIVIPNIDKLDRPLKAFTILLRVQVNKLDAEPAIRPFGTNYNLFTWHRNISDSAYAFLNPYVKLQWTSIGDYLPQPTLFESSTFCNAPSIGMMDSRDSGEVLNKWNTIAMVYDQGTMKLIDNCKVSINADVAPPVTTLCGTAPMQISLGNAPQALILDNVARYFTGKIDDLQIYTRALTDQEIKTYSDKNCLEQPIVQSALTKETCRPNAINFMDASDMKGWPVYKRIWQINNISKDTASNFTHVFTDTGNYRIRLTVFTDSVNNYTYDTTITIEAIGNVHFLFPADTLLTVCKGGSVSYTLPVDAQYMWEPCTYLSNCNSKSVIITPETNASYKINGTNVYGCNDSVRINVQVIGGDVQVYVPNAFTPNSDNLNDTFGPLSAVVLSGVNMHIYNRFGEVIFSSQKQTSRWNGTFKGMMQPEGVYVFTLSYSAANGCPVIKEKGTVQLIK